MNTDYWNPEIQLPDVLICVYLWSILILTLVSVCLRLILVFDYYEQVHDD
jgi:hypothetical protein